jgi:hypothetical protein
MRSKGHAKIWRQLDKTLRFNSIRLVIVGLVAMQLVYMKRFVISRVGERYSLEINLLGISPHWE